MKLFVFLGFLILTLLLTPLMLIATGVNRLSKPIIRGAKALETYLYKDKGT